MKNSKIKLSMFIICTVVCVAVFLAVTFFYKIDISAENYDILTSVIVYSPSVLLFLVFVFRSIDYSIEDIGGSIAWIGGIATGIGRLFVLNFLTEIADKAMFSGMLSVDIVVVYIICLITVFANFEGGGGGGTSIGGCALTGSSGCM